MGKKAAKKVTLRWKMHTPNLLKEILNNPSCGILRVPLNILSNILAELGECASRINDPELNELMCRLTIYEIADPESKEYDPKMLQRISRLSRRSKELRQKTLVLS